MPEGTSVIVNVSNCARCGGDHNNVEFDKLQRPIVENDGTEYPYWALCPATGEPILLTVVSLTV